MRQTKRFMARVAQWPHVVALLVLMLAGFRPISAATRVVPQEYPTVQSAIDASATGDTVLLSPGVYRGAGNRDIEMRGRDLVITSSHGAESTIIDCEYAGRGFYVHEHESPAARIEHLTIRSGRGDPAWDFGGGILCDYFGSPTIADCIIAYNQASRGAGIAPFGSFSTVQRCRISGNLGEEGGGISTDIGTNRIEDCVIVSNMCAQGGALHSDNLAHTTLVGCTLTDNYAGSGGGGISAYSGVVLERCVLWGNSSWDEGHELYAYARADLQCCAIDTTGVLHCDEPVLYDPDCVFTDPLFCDPFDGTLHADSPCLPEHSPCGELIGALGLGCGAPAPTGACCRADDSCIVQTEEQCRSQGGRYIGDNQACEPNPCVTTVQTTSWGRIKSRFR